MMISEFGGKVMYFKLKRKLFLEILFIVVLFLDFPVKSRYYEASIYSF